MKSDLEEYQGLWVCLCEDEVIASGKNATEVYKEAKKAMRKTHNISGSYKRGRGVHSLRMHNMCSE